MDVFAEKIEKVLYSFSKQKVIFTEEDLIKYLSEKICHICEEEFIPDNKSYCKARDHCHYTGKYYAIYTIKKIACSSNVLQRISL